MAPSMAAPGTASIVLALRQSPDWEALAADHAAGREIAPPRYMPAHDVPFFANWIPSCIVRWNAMFAVDFFACRAELRRIARGTLDRVAGAHVVTRAELLGCIPDGDFRLFFLDDDDWFAPDSRARMACAGDEDVSVFPLPRLDSPVVTFVRAGTVSRHIVGRPQDFTFRYQTNNYGLHRRLTTPVMLHMLADHADASATADRIGLTDAYHDVVLSATNKTPASASVLMRIVNDGAAFRKHVQDFIEALQAIDLPSDASWMQQPILETVQLFRRVLG